tara:strand:+ start:418 stop:834 length:417 start_codon:yes stop_codon:yes gene_type:complete
MCKVKLRKGVLSDTFVDSPKNPYNPIPLDSILLKPIEYSFKHYKFLRPVAAPRNVLMLSQNLANYHERTTTSKSISEIIIQTEKHIIGLAQVKNSDDLPKETTVKVTDDDKLSNADTHEDPREDTHEEDPYEDPQDRF